ncbi:MAG TPA: hypothetical protein VKE74_18150 [Gemmataceae bacterium]|nr:hypothetical protein [Gemmataceae bacterium]
MPEDVKTAERYELVVEVGDVTTFRLRVYEGEEDRLGYFLTSRGKKSAANPLVKVALHALAEEWPQPTVEFTADKDRQIKSIGGS